MNLYEWTLLIHDIPIKTGTVHARSDKGADTRVQAEVLPKHVYDQYVIRRLNCEECGSGNDVAAYYKGDTRFVQCLECRSPKK